MEKTMQVNGREFTIIKLLGKGKGGYSYLASDGQRQYVLKQIHHEPCDYYQFGNKMEAEIRDYGRLKSVGIRMPEMLEVDIPQERILKEYIDGEKPLSAGYWKDPVELHGHTLHPHPPHMP